MFPPVGIAHVTDDLVNLCLRPSFGSASIRVNTSAQPNSAPHVGSVLTILCSFALAKRIRTRGMHSSLQFDCLEECAGHAAFRRRIRGLRAVTCRHAGPKHPW